VNIRNFESNSYFSILFDSKPAQLFEIFEYLPRLEQLRIWNAFYSNWLTDAF